MPRVGLGGRPRGRPRVGLGERLRGRLRAGLRGRLRCSPRHEGSSEGFSEGFAHVAATARVRAFNCRTYERGPTGNGRYKTAVAVSRGGAGGAAPARAKRAKRWPMFAMGSRARGLCSIPRECEPSEGAPFDMIRCRLRAVSYTHLTLPTKRIV